MNSKGVFVMRRIVLGLVTALLVSVPVSAQTYLTSTTLTNAITAGQSSLVVGSGTGIAAGGALYVDRELMSVRSISGTTVQVIRGQGGTVANTHGAARTIIILPAAALGAGGATTAVDPSGGSGVGTCTLAEQRYQPIINVTNGNLWLCRYTAAAQTARVWAATNNVLITYNSLLLNLQ